MPWSDPIALLLQAGVAYVEGDARSAVAHLHAAADRFERADMQLYLAVTRRRIGSLQKDERGRDLQQLAAQWMAEQGIKNPTCMTRMLAPGFPDDHEAGIAASRSPKTHCEAVVPSRPEVGSSVTAT
jgi:hypothetical protein